MIRRIIGWSGIAITVAVCLLLVNQILQLADFAARIDPTLGQGVFWALIFALALSFSVPVVLIIRLPSPLLAPESEDDPSFPDHLKRLRKRLSSNPLLQDRQLEGKDDVEAALAELDEVATRRIRQAASRAFLTTAISQNGALDSIVVVGIQSRLTWDIATVYSQRPRLRELTYLYSNVVATAFLAGELDDADVAEAMEPALSAVLGSAVGFVPGMQVASSVFVNSVMSGTANAFLTLRVGVIAREYSRAWTTNPRKSLRRAALAQASALLGAIVLDGASRVSGAIGRGAARAAGGAMTGTAKAARGAATGAGRAVADTVKGTGERIVTTGSAVRDRLRPRRRPGPSDEPEPSAE